MFWIHHNHIAFSQHFKLGGLNGICNSFRPALLVCFVVAMLCMVIHFPVWLFLWLLDTLVKLLLWLISCISSLTLSHLKTSEDVLQSLCSLMPAPGPQQAPPESNGGLVEVHLLWWRKSCDPVSHYLVNGLGWVRNSQWPNSLHRMLPGRVGVHWILGRRAANRWLDRELVVVWWYLIGCLTLEVWTGDREGKKGHS